jgi:hypothetical protein
MALTHPQLAAAFNAKLADETLHVDAVTIGRYLKRQPTPLTPPAEGEPIEAWAVRAQRWRAENLKRPGPKPRAARGSELDRAELRKKRAEAALKELELAERREEVHSVPECEELQVRRFQEMSRAFAGFANALAPRLHMQSIEAIAVILDDEIRRRIEIVAPRQGAPGADVLAGAAGRDPAT